MLVPAYTPVQDGQVISGIGPWSEVEADLYVYGTAFAPAGIAFEVPTGVMFTAMTLTLAYGDWLGIEGALSVVLRVLLMPGPTPAPWTDANRPTTAGATLVATATIPTDPSPLVLPIDLAAVAAVAATPGWNGRLAFVIAGDITLTYVQVFAQENSTPALRPVLTTAETVEPTSGPLRLRRPSRKRYQPHPRKRLRTE